MNIKTDMADMQAKSLKSRGESRELRNLHHIPSIFKGVRKKCIECVCGSAHEVRMCHISDCPLWPFRFGRNPKADDLKVPEYDKNGNHIGYREYEGWESAYPWGSGE